MSERPPLRRSRSRRIFGGVCGGFAEWSGQSAALIRILYILISVISAAFPGFVVYLVLWLLITDTPVGPGTPRSTAGRNILIGLVVLTALILGLVASVLGVLYLVDRF